MSVSWNKQLLAGQTVQQPIVLAGLVGGLAICTDRELASWLVVIGKTALQSVCQPVGLGAKYLAKKNAPISSYLYDA